MQDQFTAEVLLDKLVELKAQVDVISIEKQQLIDSVLTPEIRQQIQDIEAEFKPMMDDVNQAIGDTEAHIKADILARGETAHNDVLEAVFVNGRTTWDTKGLNEAIKVLPQLEQYKKTGDPYVTIRARSVKK